MGKTGNYRRRIVALHFFATTTKIEGLKMAGAAFTAETDPHPNPAALFSEALSGTGIILNARMVGNPDLVAETTRSRWTPEMKMIVLTFSESPEEQEQVYDMAHGICQ